MIAAIVPGVGMDVAKKHRGCMGHQRSNRKGKADLRHIELSSDTRSHKVLSGVDMATVLQIVALPQRAPGGLVDPYVQKP